MTEPSAEIAEVSEFEATARRLVAERMAYYGYTPEQIEAAAHTVDHFGSGCIWQMQRWDCENEHGRSNHPDSDEYDSTAEFVVWVMERLTTSPEGHPCGHSERTPGCGGCDPGAVEFVITDEGERRPFDAALDMNHPPEPC